MLGSNKALLTGAMTTGTLIYMAAANGLASDVVKPSAAAQAITQEQQTFFETKVRPVLATRCYSCHGSERSQGQLRLDSRDAILKGGSHGAAIIPGSPERSLLISAIGYNAALKMPPTGMLRSDEIAALTAWVKMGAPWPEAAIAKTATKNADMVITDAQRNFWSFRPVRKPTLPAVKNASWCTNEIDRFVLANLEAHGLKPAQTADRRSLIRRVTFDLIGLPPTPAEVDAFVNDTSPRAWQKVIDRLLANPHYGERWGRNWLDVVRYADSNGLDENVAFANSFRYRDYVVKAFNQDKPYDQFIQEQLAGDLMPTNDETLRNDRITATGFLTLGPKLLAEPDKGKMVMDIVDEQIEVTSKAFLGLTVACARCHNHKFDPIPTKDYYALAGIFKSTKSMATLNTVAMWHERPLHSDKLETELAAYKRSLAKAEENLALITKQADSNVLESIRANSASYLQAAWELAQQGDLLPIGSTVAPAGDTSRIYVEAIKYTRGDSGRDTENYGKGIGIIHNVGGANQDEWDIDVPRAGAYQLEIRYSSGANRPIRVLFNGAKIAENAAGEKTGSFYPDTQRWEVVGLIDCKAGKNVLRIEGKGDIPHINRFLIAPAVTRNRNLPVQTPDAIAARHKVNIDIVRSLARMAADIRVNPETMSAQDRAIAIDNFSKKIALPAKPAALYTELDRKKVADAAKAVEELKKAEPRPVMVMAVEDSKGENCRVHIRGDTQNLGAEVPRHFLTVLNGDKSVVDDANRSGRLELAQWITRPQHPLTSRVEVNRIWQAHFGAGIVQTPDNWGFLGLRPTNPDLLDWLAAAFIEQGWSIKKLHRLILSSSAYRMSTIADPKTEQVASKSDPDNNLLWKMPRRRLEAEQFRDAILATSGQIDLSIGGSLLNTGNHDYVTNDQSGNGANYGAKRRSIYLPIIRNALFDMFQAFDYGDPSMVNAKRATTTVAPQALYVMNSPFVIEQSAAFSRDLLARKELTDDGRIQAAYARALARPASSEEIRKVMAYIASYSARLPATIADTNKRRELGWASFCQLLFASNEFIYMN